MKTSKRNKLLGLALTGSFSLFSASSVFAAAGDTVSNFATLNYDVGGSPQTLIESGSGAGNSVPGAGYAVANNLTTDFIEDRVINFDIVRFGATGDAVPAGTLQPVTFRLTNNGNAPQGFLLKGLNNADGTADPWGGSADEFDATLIQTFVESGGVPGYDPTDVDAFVATLAAGASVDVYVVSTLPLNDSGGNPLVNTNVAVMSLVAQAAINGSTGIAADAIVADDNQNVSPGGANFTNGTANVTAGTAGPVTPDDPTNEEVVFGEAAGTQDGTGAADIASNAQHSDDSSYTIVTASLNVTKDSVAWWDPVNLNVDPKSFPTAYVRYTITVLNTGTVAADLTTLSDVLPATLDLDLNLGDGTAANAPTVGAGVSVQVTHVDNAVTNSCTGAADADGCTYVGGPGGTLTVDINAVMGGAPDAQLGAGQSLTIVFNVIVQ